MALFGGLGSVGDVRWFCRGDEDWLSMAERLKLTPCPHCNIVGTLIQHGYLRGYDDNNLKQKAVRARRIFCSNRNARHGCGRTSSIWLADKIRRLSLNAATLWRFLQHAIVGSILAAARTTDCHLSDRTWQRIWTRFNQGQSQIRTALLGLCPPPELPAEASRWPTAAHVLAHLQATFPHADCPITTFQHTMRTFFV